MGSWFSTVMDVLPLVASDISKLFPSSKAVAQIKSDPEGVYKAQKTYQDLTSSGRARLLKQQTTGMDRSTLCKAVTIIQDKWGESMKSFELFETLIESATKDWKFDSNTVEQLESNSDGTKLLYLKIVNNCEKYHLAICYFEAEVQVNQQILLGGLISEGLLAKDDKNNIYLNFE